MLCQKIINECYLPNSFSYLEIGIGNKIQYNSVHTNKKLCVDINGNADYNSGSDSFFKDYAGDKFDVIFIDGDHQINSVVKDYNHSLDFLNEGGVIFLHDLLPPDEKHCSPSSCGDGFKLLNYFVDNNYNYKTIAQDFGLTLTYNNKDKVKNVQNVSYTELINKTITLTSVEEVVKFLKEYKK